MQFQEESYAERTAKAAARFPDGHETITPVLDSLLLPGDRET